MNGNNQQPVPEHQFHPQQAPQQNYCWPPFAQQPALQQFAPTTTPNFNFFNRPRLQRPVAWRNPNPMPPSYLHPQQQPIPFHQQFPPPNMPSVAAEHTLAAASAQQVHQNEAMLKQLREALADREKMVEQLKAENAAAQEKVHQQNDQAMISLREALADRENLNEQLKTENAAAQEKIQMLQKELDEIHHAQRNAVKQMIDKRTGTDEEEASSSSSTLIKEEPLDANDNTDTMVNPQRFGTQTGASMSTVEENERQSLRQQLENERALLAQCRIDLEQANAELKSAEKRLDDSARKNEKLDDKMQHYKRKAERLDEDADRMRDDRRALRHEVDKLKQLLDQAVGRHAKCEEEMRKKEETLTQLQLELDARQTNDNLVREKDEQIGQLKLERESMLDVLVLARDHMQEMRTEIGQIEARVEAKYKQRILNMLEQMKDPNDAPTETMATESQQIQGKKGAKKRHYDAVDGDPRSAAAMAKRQNRATTLEIASSDPGQPQPCSSSAGSH